VSNVKQELKLTARDSLLTFADDMAQKGGAVRAEEAEPERHLVIFGLDREEFAEILARVDHGVGPSRDVDLLIRTGGEQRLSDFLLWECAYAELYFTRRMWPEFSPADLREAVDEFSARERRFGTVPAAAAG